MLRKNLVACISTGIHSNATWRKTSEYQSYAAALIFSVTTKLGIP